MLCTHEPDADGTRLFCILEILFTPFALLGARRMHIIPLFRRAGAFALCCTQALPDLLLHSHDDEESDEVRRVNFLILGQRTIYKFYLGEYQKHAYFQPLLTHSIPHRQTSFIHLHISYTCTRHTRRISMQFADPAATSSNRAPCFLGRCRTGNVEKDERERAPTLPPLSLPPS